MRLDECITLALRQNVDALTSEAQVDEARAGSKAAWGELGPKLRAEGNALQWGSAFNIPFALGSGPPAFFPVHDAFTWTVAGSVIQPVTPLFGIYEQYKVKDLGVDVAGLERDVTRRDVAFRVGEAYFRLLEAARLAEVAAVSVKQLEAQRAQAQSLFTNGVVGRGDLLRADLALASARERVIQAEGQITLTRGRLALLMGLPADSPIDPMPIVREGEPPPEEDTTISAAEARAVAGRAELRALQVRIQQADRNVTVAREKLLPQANVVGNYTHTEGYAFAQKDAAYVGVTATWDVWDWGTNWHGIDEAKARRRQAELARTKLEDQVRLEARQAYVDTATARQALVVSRAALEAAEENYRIVTKRYAAANATSFDVVDAEALLTQARARIETALYDYVVARGALQRATGSPLPHVP